MNISGLIRGLAGGMQAAEPKTLELKPGQVVKGVVLQVYDNQEAQMSIDGVQVRAKLETPLAPGQTAWLQVQPESTGGQVVLKPAAGPAVPATQEEIGQMLKQTGLKDTAVNRELVQMMKQQGIPLTKEAAAPLQDIMSRIPASVKPEQWVQAVGVAVSKGLPLTADTVGAIHQALFGKPFGETLQNLAQTLSGLLQNGGLAEGTNGSGEKLLRQLADVLRTMQDTTAEVGGSRLRTEQRPLWKTEPASRDLRRERLRQIPEAVREPPGRRIHASREEFAPMEAGVLRRPPVKAARCCRGHRACRRLRQECPLMEAYG